MSNIKEMNDFEKEEYANSVSQVDTSLIIFGSILLFVFITVLIFSGISEALFTTACAILPVGIICSAPIITHFIDYSHNCNKY